MIDPRPVVFSVLEDIVPCPDRSFVYSVSGLQEGWLREAPAEYQFFWVDLFVQNPELSRRMRAAYHAIGSAFADLEKLHAAVYGTPTRVPRAIVELVRRRALNGWFESSREALNFATGAATAKAAADLKRLISLEAWTANLARPIDPWRIGVSDG